MRAANRIHARRELGIRILGGLVVWGLLTGTGAARAAEEAAPTSPAGLHDPREILDGFPAFDVQPRVPVLEDGGYYPCSDCHDNEFQVSNPQIRVLEEMHDDIELDHGGGRFWCLSCHHSDERDALRSLEGQPISFDESFLLCGQCHFERQVDFFFGAHGRRVGSWRGERLIVPCTDCHDAHRPAIEPRPAYAPPPVRRGLESSHGPPHRRAQPWERERGNPRDTPEEPPR